VNNFWNGFEKRADESKDGPKKGYKKYMLPALGLGAAAITLGSVVGATKSYRKLRAARRQAVGMADSFIKERARATKDFGHKNTEAMSALEKERQLFRDHQKELEKELSAAKRMVDKK